MKKWLSFLLAVAMCFGAAAALIPAVSAEITDTTAATGGGAVYYEENFDSAAYADLVDADLAAAIGWTAPNKYQTMMIENGKLRIVAQYTPSGVKASSGWATAMQYKVLEDERLKTGATVIEYKFTYQSKRDAEGNDLPDVNVTLKDGSTKTIKNDGQGYAQTAAFCSWNSAHSEAYWVAQILPDGSWDANRNVRLNGWQKSLNNSTGKKAAPTVASYEYDYNDDPTGGTTTAASIMDREHTVKIVIDPELSGIGVWIDGVLLTIFGGGQRANWITNVAPAVFSETLSFRVQPGMDVLIDDIKVHDFVPEMVISELCVGNQSGKDANGKPYSIEWFELTNTSDQPINIYDYAIWFDNAPWTYSATFSLASGGKDIAYLYPGSHTYTYSGGQNDASYNYQATYVNPAYAEGVLQPGECAIVATPTNGIGWGLDGNALTVDILKSYAADTLGYTGEVKAFIAYSNNNFTLANGNDNWKIYGLSKVVNRGSDTAANYQPHPVILDGANQAYWNLVSWVVLCGRGSSSAMWSLTSDSARIPKHEACAPNKSLEFTYWNANGGSQHCGQMVYNYSQNRGSRKTTNSFGEMPEDCRRTVWVEVVGLNGARTVQHGRQNVAFKPEAAAVENYRFDGFTYGAVTDPVTTIPAAAMTGASVSVTAVYTPLLPIMRGWQKTAVSDNVFSVRFLSTVNDLSAASLGYRIEVSYTEGGTPVTRTGTRSCSYVYTSVLANVDGTTEEVTAGELGGAYIFALHLDNVPANVGELTFTVTPYSADEEGNKTFGTGMTFTCNPSAH